MNSIKLFLLLTLAVLFAALAFQNQKPWEVRFLWLVGEVPAIIVSFLTAAAGFSAGIISALLVKSSKNKTSK